MNTMRSKISQAIFDPGQFVGMKGDRSLTKWQEDAVMQVLSDLTESVAIGDGGSVPVVVMGLPNSGNRHHEAKAESMGIATNVREDGEFGEGATIVAPDYVIWSNEHRAWWAPGERGYVRSLAEAGRYSQSRATMIAASQWRMPFDGIPNEIAMRLVDAQWQVDGTPFA